MSPRTKEACEGAKAVHNGLDMEWDGITLGNQISCLDWTSTILAASTLVSAHILLHVPMSSEKWGSSQMLGTTSTKTIVDYRDGTQLFAPVDNNWCQGNHLICQFCQKICFTLSHHFVPWSWQTFWFWDSRTEIDTIPLTHWKNLGWNWVDSLGPHLPLERAISAAKSHNSHAENITTRVPNTSPAGWWFSSLHEFKMSDMRLS